jgi:hypothetical protein
MGTRKLVVGLDIWHTSAALKHSLDICVVLGGALLVNKRVETLPRSSMRSSNLHANYIVDSEVS